MGVSEKGVGLGACEISMNARESLRDTADGGAMKSNWTGSSCASAGFDVPEDASTLMVACTHADVTERVRGPVSGRDEKNECGVSFLSGREQEQQLLVALFEPRTTRQSGEVRRSRHDNKSTYWREGEWISKGLYHAPHPPHPHTLPTRNRPRMHRNIPQRKTAKKST